MKLRKVDGAVLGAAILLVILVSLLPAPRDQNPPVPSNVEHMGVASTKQCTTCHTKDGVSPLTARHPKRQDCYRCHREPTDLNVEKKHVALKGLAVSQRPSFRPHP